MDADHPRPVRRHSLRLPHYDYAQAGAYFVTICIQDRRCLFAAIEDAILQPTPAGHLAESVWATLSTRFPGLSLDVYVIMPNHLHGIVVLPDRSLGAESAGRRPIPPLGAVIRAFKAATTRQIRQAGLTEFAWQPDYYEHVIRSDADLARIRQYIEDNPSRWATDPEHPQAPAR